MHIGSVAHQEWMSGWAHKRHTFDPATDTIEHPGNDDCNNNDDTHSSQATNNKHYNSNHSHSCQLTMGHGHVRSVSSFQLVLRVHVAMTPEGCPGGRRGLGAGG